MTPASDITLRPATLDDVGVINDIYNHYVRTSPATFQVVESTIVERQAWLTQRSDAHPVIVAERDGRVIAWGDLSPFHARCAYGHTVTNALYVHHEHHGRGVGKAVIERLIELARRHGHHTIIALIAHVREPSIKLHEKYGFVEVGRLREVGHKFDQWLDVVYMQLML